MRGMRIWPIMYIMPIAKFGMMLGCSDSPSGRACLHYWCEWHRAYARIFSMAMKDVCVLTNLIREMHAFSEDTTDILTVRVALQRSNTSVDPASNQFLYWCQYIIPTRIEETLTPSSWYRRPSMEGTCRGVAGAVQVYRRWYQLYFVARRFGIGHGSKINANSLARGLEGSCCNTCYASYGL